MLLLLQKYNNIMLEQDDQIEESDLMTWGKVVGKLVMGMLINVSHTQHICQLTMSLCLRLTMCLTDCLSLCVLVSLFVTMCLIVSLSGSVCLAQSDCLVQSVCLSLTI